MNINRTWFTMAGFLLLALVVGLFALHSKKGLSEEGIEQDILTAILSENPYLVKEGQPMVELSALDSIETNWFIATIRSVNSPKQPDVKLVLLHDMIKPRIIFGPEIDFSEDDLIRFNIPDSVILELLNS